jgi:hypothetical protein
MLALSGIEIVFGGHQQGGLAVVAIGVANGAVIQAPPLNPAAIHETALVDGANRNQRRPLRIRSESTASSVSLLAVK